MALPPDCSVRKMPRWLWVLAAALLLLRVTGCAVSAHCATPAWPTLAWLDFSEGTIPLAPGHDKILYKFTAEWSEPCRRLDEEVFANGDVRRIAQDNFALIEVCDRSHEDGHNSEAMTALKQRFHVFAYPTLIVTNRAGLPQGSLVGCSSSLATLRFLKRQLITEPLSK